jgi:hypothetical protein
VTALSSSTSRGGRPPHVRHQPAPPPVRPSAAAQGAVEEAHHRPGLHPKADGTYVPAHTSWSITTPTATRCSRARAAIPTRRRSKSCPRMPGFKELPAEHQHAILVQSMRRTSRPPRRRRAQVSVFKKDLLAGVKPKAANIAAFKELKEADPKKAAGIMSSIAKAAIGMDKVSRADSARQRSGCARAAAARRADGGGAGDRAQEAARDRLEAARDALPLPRVEEAFGRLEGLGVVQELGREAAGRRRSGEADAGRGDGRREDLDAHQEAGGGQGRRRRRKWRPIVALATTAKMKAIKSAVKKSGNKLSLEKINELLDQGAAKAGIEMVEAPRAEGSCTSVSSTRGRPLGTPNGQSGQVQVRGRQVGRTGPARAGARSTTPSGRSDLGEGQHPVLKKPLQVVVTDPARASARAERGYRVYDGGSYVRQVRGRPVVVQIQGHQGSEVGWHALPTTRWSRRSTKVSKYGNGSGPLEQLDDDPRSRTTASGSIARRIPGMSGNPT